MKAHQKNVLIIEDNVFFAKIIINWLEEDYNVFHYTSIEQALAVPNQKADVILLDNNFGYDRMTSKEGIGFIEELFPNVPIIILTVEENMQTAIDMLKLGACDYLLKNDPSKDKLEAIFAKLFHYSNVSQEIKKVRTKISNESIRLIILMLLFAVLAFI